MRRLILNTPEALQALGLKALLIIEFSQTPQLLLFLVLDAARF